MCSSTPYRWPIYSNDSIMEFSNREFSFMETSFPEIFCQGFFFHGKFFSWNFPFHEIKIFPGIFLIMENSFHGICFHSIFFLKFSFMEKKFMENSCSHFRSKFIIGKLSYKKWFLEDISRSLLVRMKPF